MYDIEFVTILFIYMDLSRHKFYKIYALFTRNNLFSHNINIIF